ncbi:uncharacterized protein LOC111368995 [Olea europaea var. sylvestris]|uniref:uncharacterized protein LOC111368995 n=1 Tax=Olea europaea var. sylvestris TaxID=158386 RepID=UPI000C1CD662|nr:uncharacterized protein LOC111368995 [Olea europaea var. sylvestris]
MVNYLVTNEFPPELSRAQQDKVKSDAQYYVWDDPYLWKHCAYQVIRRCIPENEIMSILIFCHSYACGGFLWIKKDGKEGNIFQRNIMPQTPILVCEIFYVWGIDFMGPFPTSFGYAYILLAVDYVSKWVKAKATRTNDSKVVSNFIKSNIFSRFGIPRALISDQGTHFCNRTVGALLRKYHVTHKVSTTYHPQTSGQAELSNREIKSIIKMTDCIQDTYWNVTLQMDENGEHGKLQLQELEEIRNDAH